ncbi:MAG: HDOD domain-containing protein [Desulfobulbaceae bacterium]|nr:HDOD domain-containing protein [Desulfobulbaceae bacterium]
MNKNTLSVLADRIKSFPPLPSIVTQVLKITSDPESSSRDLFKVIRPDQSLATAILKMANSTFFGLTRTVSSLEQALTVLGYTETRNLVLAKSVFSSFKGMKNSGTFDVRKFWEHSFLCGIAAKIISPEAGETANELFVAGLIHDIGKLVILIAMPEKFEQIIKASPTGYRTFQAEQSIIDLTHDQVGMNLLKRWMFPDSLTTAAGFHHTPGKAAGEHVLFPLMVHVADLLAHSIESTGNDQPDPEIEEALFNTALFEQCGSHGLRWDDSVIRGFQVELKREKEEEAGVLSILMS